LKRETATVHRRDVERHQCRSRRAWLSGKRAPQLWILRKGDGLPIQLRRL